MYNLRNRHRCQSFRRYVKKRMRESLIIGEPKVESSKSGSRKVVRSITFLVCTAGFLYQTYTFVESFLKYETIQNFRVEHPIKFMAPALTFCNKNRINRNRFCKALPEECFWYKTEKDFCKAEPKLCITYERFRVLGVPLKISHSYLNLSNEFLDAYGQQTPWEFIRNEAWAGWGICELHRHGDIEKCKDNDSILIQAASSGLPYKCFTIYSLLNKPNEEPRKISINDGYSFRLHPHREQLMNGKDNIQFYMYVHDPRRLANPMAEGITLNGGYSYTFSFTMQQRQNLPPPYDTNCVDYVTKWKENGGRGPITKKDCIELCKIERMMEQHSCVGKSITYPHRFPICLEIINIPDNVVEKCSSGCREACNSTVYTIAVENTEDLTDKDCDGTKGGPYCKKESIEIAIRFSHLMVQKIVMEPKFQDIEFFSYVGGYIGMWLGISLVTFVDFLETVTDVVTKWKKAYRNKNIRRMFL